MVLAPDSARLQREIEFVLQVLVGQHFANDVVRPGDVLGTDSLDFGVLALDFELNVYDDVGLRPGDADEDAARIWLVERLFQIFHLSFHQPAHTGSADPGTATVVGAEPLMFRQIQ